MVMRPNAPKFSQALLAATLFLKLPFYAVGLYLMARLGAGAPFSFLLGVSMAPLVITLKTVGGIREARPARRGMQVIKAPSAVPTQRPARTVPQELAGERG